MTERNRQPLTVYVTPELRESIREEVRRQQRERPGAIVTVSDVVREGLFKLFPPKTGEEGR